MADNNNPIKYSDLVKPDDSITKLISQLDQLSDAYMNALNNIKSEAITVRAALSSVSGATEDGRKSIRGATSDTDKLARAARELAFAESENAKKLLELRQARKEADDLNKLIIRRNQSAEGTYNRLSAQYSINKIYLNNMTVAEREATEDGRKLEAETKAIYEEMKRLQEATGKTSLNVGNYGDATQNLTTLMRENTRELAMMRLAGEQGSSAYQQLAEETGRLRGAMQLTTAESNRLASSTATLDSVLSGAAAAGGGFAAFTGAMQLFGVSSDSVQEAQKKLQAAIAITTGLQAVQSNLLKTSAVMLGINQVQTMALAKAEAYRRLIQIQGTKATIGATVAQKLFNLVAAANPYVLLAMALITVVGALVLFSSSADDAAEKQKKLNEMRDNQLKYYEEETKAENRRSKEIQNRYQAEIVLAQASGKSLKEIRAIEDKMFAERKKNAANLANIRREDIRNLDKNIERTAWMRTELRRLSKLDPEVKVGVNLGDGKVIGGKVKDLIALTQQTIDQFNVSIDVALEIKEQQTKIETDEAQIKRERIKQAQTLAKAELDIIRKAEDEKLKLLTDEAEKQRIAVKNDYARRIEDLRLQLKQDENLTLNARNAINEQIKALEQNKRLDLIDLENKLTADLLAITRNSEDMRIAAMVDGIEKEREQLNVSYDRQIEDLRIKLATKRNLSIEETEAMNKDIENLTIQHNNALDKLNAEYAITQLQRDADNLQLKLEAAKEGSEEEMNLRIQLLQKQRAIELAQNARLSSDLRQSEADINAKYDAMVLKETTNLTRERGLLMFDQQQALAQSEFDLLRNSEERKTRFRLAAEKARLQKILELNKAAGVKMTAEEVATIENTIAKIDQEIAKSKGDERGNDIYGLFGLNLDDDQKEAISTSVEFAMEQLDVFLQAKIAAAEQAVAAADKEVDASQRRLDAELEARNNGYANNVVMAQKELDNAKKTQDKALKEQQKAQKAQQQIETLKQIGSLVTASAMIWSQLGFPFAIPAIAVMWGSFAASKIKAAQMSKQASSGSESYGDGTVELLAGGSHQSGNDVDLGTKTDGTRRRAEGGEFFAVINKRNSRRFRGLIPDVIRSLNNGTFAHKYMSAYDGANGLSLNIGNETPDISDLKNDVKEIKEQNQRCYFVDGNGNTVLTYKNLKRIIKN